MSNVIVTPPPTGGFSAGNATTAVAVLDANPALANLEAGSLVQGVVVGRDARGQTVLETEFGQVALTSRVPLPVGSDVVLQIQSAGARLTVIVLSVNNQPIANLGRLPPLPLPPLPNAPAGPEPGPVDNLPAAQVTLSTGTVVTATVLRPAVAAAPAAGPATVATSGTATASQGQTPAPSSAPRVLLDATPVAPGSQFPVRIAAIEPPQASSAAPGPGPGPDAQPAPAAEPPAPEPPLAAPAPASSSLGRLTGVVLGSTISGQVELRTELGLLELALPSEPPTGSVILFELLGLPKAPAAAQPPAGGGPTPPAAALAQEWPALREALGSLAGAPTGVPQPVPAAHPGLPRIGPQLALGLLAFLAALDSNEAGRLLPPETVRQLEDAGQEHLIGRLRDDFGQLSRLAAGQGPGDWRSFFLPIQDERLLSQVRFFLKRREERPRAQAQAPAKPAPAGHRFIIELELGRLGALQLDGFLKAKHLNLILRSRQPLPDRLRETLRSRFAEANALAGLTGTLGFQDRLGQFPLAPLDALRGKGQAVVV